MRGARRGSGEGAGGCGGDTRPPPPAAPRRAAPRAVSPLHARVGDGHVLGAGPVLAAAAPHLPHQRRKVHAEKQGSRERAAGRENERETARAQAFRRRNCCLNCKHTGSSARKTARRERPRVARVYERANSARDCSTVCGAARRPRSPRRSRAAAPRVCIRAARPLAHTAQARALAQHPASVPPHTGNLYNSLFFFFFFGEAEFAAIWQLVASASIRTSPLFQNLQPLPPSRH